MMHPVDRSLSTTTTALCAFFVTLWLAPQAAHGQTTFTYQFSGFVTSIEDPMHGVRSFVSNNSPVTGFFTYTTAPSFSFPGPNDVDYLYSSFPARMTDMVLTINGHSVQEDDNSLTNLDIANNDPLQGDTVSVFNGMSGINSNAIFDFSDAVNNDPSLFVPFFAQVQFNDSTGQALSSTDLPAPLPSFSAFDQSTGSLIAVDGNNFTPLATINFRITSLQAVPEPGSLAMLMSIVLGGGGLLWRRHQSKLQRCQH